MGGSDDSIEQSLRIAIILTLVFFLAEVAGGFLSNSLSLLSDAGHMFRDALALLISFSAIRISKRLPTRTKTFGYHRVEIFAALFNSIMLLGISVFIFLEALERIGSPPVIDAPLMFVVAIMGLFINIYIGLRLHGSEDLNVKSAYFHVLSDALSSLMIVIGSIFIHFTGNGAIDPIVSIIIVIVIVISSFGIMRSSIRILLEFTPEGVDLEKLIDDLEGIDEVSDVHNVRLWSICSNINAFDAHFVVGDRTLNDAERIKSSIRIILADHKIQYSTIELECDRCEAPHEVGVAPRQGKM